MATPFFGKREPETPTNLRSGTTGTTGAYPGNSSASSSPLNSQSTGSSTSGMNPSSTKSMVETVSTEGGGSKLTVGPNIKLKGVEITDCDTLVVEGLVEATMDSRVIQISETGSFKGSAEIDIAEIRGEFNGNLTVRQKLVIHATGKVTGKIRYGKLVVEEGGQLSGEITYGAGATSAGVSGMRPAQTTTQPSAVKQQNLQTV
jgi:cytoskeletal protein CcmA (bactofilin family)